MKSLTSRISLLLIYLLRSLGRFLSVVVVGSFFNTPPLLLSYSIYFLSGSCYCF